MLKRHKELRKIVEAIPFMLPSFVGMIFFSLLPIIMATGISLTDWSGLEKFTLRTIPEHFTGLDNYVQILRGREFWRTLWHVVYFIIAYIPLVFVFSMLIALILNSGKRLTGIMRVFFYVPVLTSWVATSLIWKWVLSSQYGIVNSFLKLLGVAGPDWLTDRVWAMPGIVLASVWKDMGYYGLFIFGGLRGIDPTYYEAAKVDGASKFTVLTKITLPLLTPTIFYCMVMSLINAFQLFPQVQIMTEGGPNGATQVIVERIYTYAFSYFKMGYAASYSWLLFVIIFALTLLQLRLQKVWVHYES